MNDSISEQKNELMKEAKGMGFKQNISDKMCQIIVSPTKKVSFERQEEELSLDDLTDQSEKKLEEDSSSSMDSDDSISKKKKKKIQKFDDVEVK